MLNFPSTPTNGQQYSKDGRTWEWRDSPPPGQWLVVPVSSTDASAAASSAAAAAVSAALASTSEVNASDSADAAAGSAVAAAASAEEAAAEVLGRVLTGLSTSSDDIITDADTVIAAFGKLQAQILAGAGLLQAGGSAESPSVPFAGDADTGIYQGEYADQLGISAGGELQLLAKPTGVELSNVPVAPTPAPSTDTTQLATTAFVWDAVQTVGIAGAATSNGVFDLNSAPLGSLVSVNGTETQGASNNWPATGQSGSADVWFNVLTTGSPTRTTQIAVYGFSNGNGRMFLRMKHDTTWTSWVEVMRKDALRLGTVAAMEVARELKSDIGVYSYRVNNVSTDKPAGLTYGSALTWTGDGSLGAGQIVAGWDAGTEQNFLAWRSLRDDTSDWWPWKRIYHEGYKPAVADVTGLQTALDTTKTQLEANSQTGTSYTLVLSDAGKRVARSNSSANTTTVPPNSSVAFPVNTIIFVSQDGTGDSSIVADSGVTVNTAEGLNIGGQYKMVSLIKTATDTWMLVGGVA